MGTPTSTTAVLREAGQALTRIVGVATCYLLAAYLGLKFAIPPGNATAIWPPSGIALASGLLLGPWALPGVWLGATLGNLTTAVAFPAAAAIGLGNTLEALIAVMLLRRGGRRASASFEAPKGVLSFAAVAVLASTAGAAVGVGTLEVAGHLAWHSLAFNWVTWWLGDIAGIVILTPFLVALWRDGRPIVAGASRTRWLEASLAAAALVLVSGLLFGGLLDSTLAKDLLYLPLFLLIWLALRFELLGVTAAALLFAVTAVWGTSHGVGVYGGTVVAESLLNLQVLMISYALAGLAVVATVRRRREAESESLRLARALDAVGDGILITDAEATITHVNPAFELMTGYLKSEAVGKNPRLLRSGAHDAELYRRLWRTLTHGGIWRGSLVDRRKDSALYEVDSTIAPIQEVDGSLVGYVAVSRDVTAQRTAERALKDSEMRLRTIFESAADGIVTVDKDGLIEASNPAAERMFGYARGELVGRPVAMLVPPPPGWEPERLHGLLPLGEILLPPGVVRELEGRRQDGSAFQVDLTVNELRLAGRRLFVAVIRDAGDRHARLEAERSLLRTDAELRLARTIQQRFYPRAAPALPGVDISGASHPAEQAGGDYFDYLPMRSGQLGVVIGDVSGHGLGPALLMSQTRAYLRALLLLTEDIGELLGRLNAFLAADCGERQFVTMFLARIDPASRTASYASAGHQCYLLRADGRVEALTSTGPPLGIWPDRTFAVVELALHPGELLLMVTDGLEETESPEGCELGRARVLEVAETNRHLPARDVVAALCWATTDHAAGGVQQDDITAVVVKVLG